MPYIKQDLRKDWKTTLDPLKEAITERTSIGELNYLITSLATSYAKRKGISYSILNEIVGVLECAKQEFYRKVCKPYEDKKIQENGDVYD